MSQTRLTKLSLAHESVLIKHMGVGFVSQLKGSIVTPAIANVVTLSLIIQRLYPGVDAKSSNQRGVERVTSARCVVSNDRMDLARPRAIHDKECLATSSLAVLWKAYSITASGRGGDWTKIRASAVAIIWRHVTHKLSANHQSETSSTENSVVYN
jgi:hypothetical protein